jgi:hypothetical protein
MTQVWHTKNNIVLLPEVSDWDTLQKTATLWLRFVGGWGRPAASRIEGNGPDGLAMKDFWNDGDPKIGTNNTRLRRK